MNSLPAVTFAEAGWTFPKLRRHKQLRSRIKIADTQPHNHPTMDTPHSPLRLALLVLLLLGCLFLNAACADDPFGDQSFRLFRFSISTHGVTIFIARDGDMFGEYPHTQLEALARAGHLQPDDDYWHEGMEEWALLRDFLRPQAWETDVTQRPTRQDRSWRHRRPARPSIGVFFSGPLRHYSG